MARAAVRFACLALLGATLPAACLVKDFELTDLKGAAGQTDDGASSAGQSTGGSNGASGSQNEGGDDGAGGDATPNAGTGGSGGKGGSGGEVGQLPMTFPASTACQHPEFLLCDDFEDASLSSDKWLAASGPSIEEPGGAVPSGTGVLNNGYKKVDSQVPFPDGGTLSFWVRFPTDTDYEFVTFRENPNETLTFGRESRVFRFRHHVIGEELPATAPTQLSLSPPAQTDTWACIELRGDSTRLQARVVIFGDRIVTLPIVDSVKTPDEDEEWITMVGNGPNVANLPFALGDGNSAEYDEVVLAPGYDGMSVCDYYLEEGG